MTNEIQTKRPDEKWTKYIKNYSLVPYEVVQFGDAKLQFLGGFAVRLGNTMTQ